MDIDATNIKPGMFSQTDIYECVKFGADLNKNVDLVNLNVITFIMGLLGLGRGLSSTA